MIEPVNLPRDATENSIGMSLKLIPAGEFFMGSAARRHRGRRDEKPSHRVRISKPFYLGVCEVTQAQYQIGDGQQSEPLLRKGDGKDLVAGQSTDQYPVENVSWLDAIQFCNKLSEKEGKKPFYEIDGKMFGFRTGTGRAIVCRRRRSGNMPAGRMRPLRRRFSFGDDAGELGDLRVVRR